MFQMTFVTARPNVEKCWISWKVLKFYLKTGIFSCLCDNMKMCTNTRKIPEKVTMLYRTNSNVTKTFFFIIIIFPNEYFMFCSGCVEATCLLTNCKFRYPLVVFYSFYRELAVAFDCEPYHLFSTIELQKLEQLSNWNH